MSMCDLYFVEVRCSPVWRDVVGGDANNGLISGVLC